MPKLSGGEALIPIDENLTLESIMGKPMMNQRPMDNLYEQLSESIKRMDDTKGKKKKAKAKVKAKVPAVPEAVQNPVKAQAKAQAKAQVQTDKESLIMKILKYQSSRRFGKYVSKDLKISQSREQLNKLSIDRLKNILHRIRLNLNNRNMDAIFENMALTCAKGYETTVTHLGYDIEGFTDILTQNPGFWDAFERWKIEREMPDIPPGIQLGYIIATTTLAAHTLSAGKEVTNIESRSNPQSKNDDVIITDKDDFSLGKNI